MVYWFLFLIVPLFGTEAPDLLQKYEDLHASSLRRLVILEDKIDGISGELRSLLNDRKRNYETRFKEVGKGLGDPLLTNAIITERKRLEKEESFIGEIKNSPVLARQLERKLASNLVALEATNILVTFVEFLDEFNRGVKPYQGPKDLEVMKVLAGTLTALAYSKSEKEKMALAEPAIIRLTRSETDNILKLIQSGLGKVNEDTLLFIPEGLPKKEQKRQELERLNKTKKLISMIDQLATLISVANKPLSDEYQYRVLLLNQKLKLQREISNTPPKR